MTPREHAHRLAALGFSVIPVPPPRPGVPSGVKGDGKVPAIPWTEYQTRRPTPDEIDKWFASAPMNLAIVTGAISGVVVVDCDSPDAVQWWIRHRMYTPWQTQTARGFHLWYRHPGVRVANRARIDTGAGRLPLDVRGDGGYVIGPGSVHASGAIYAEAGDWSAPRERVPVFWPGWLERAPRPAPRYRPADDVSCMKQRPAGDLVDRARHYLAAIPKPEIGCGSDAAVMSAACRLVRGFTLSAADAETLLWEWAGGRDGWTQDWIAEKVANAERYGSEPIGGLR
jgi:hypothetical protein